MQLRKYRWSKVYESAEEELLELFKQRGIQATFWAGENGQNIDGKQYPHDSRIWCAEGLLSCTTQGKTYSLQPGDALDVPAGTTLSLHVGFGGCGVYESLA
jgi:quercetin dioxygenase-like cupin family protein